MGPTQVFNELQNGYDLETMWGNAPQVPWQRPPHSIAKQRRLVVAELSS